MENIFQVLFLTLFISFIFLISISIKILRVIKKMLFPITETCSVTTSPVTKIEKDDFTNQDSGITLNLPREMEDTSSSIISYEGQAEVVETVASEYYQIPMNSPTRLAKIWDIIPKCVCKILSSSEKYDEVN